MDDKERAQRNLNPHKAARLAMVIWNEDYAFKQRGGVMDFWDSLPEGKKWTARRALKAINDCPDEPPPKGDTP